MIGLTYLLLGLLVLAVFVLNRTFRRACAVSWRTRKWELSLLPILVVAWPFIVLVALIIVDPFHKPE